MADAARILSLAAARSDFGALPRQEQAVWRDFILDTLAVMAAGAAHPSVSVARSALVAAGGAGRHPSWDLRRVHPQEPPPLPTAWR